MNHHQNALEALAQLSAVASQIDTAECKDEGLYNRLQGALAVANASLDDAMKALAAAPQVYIHTLPVGATDISEVVRTVAEKQRMVIFGDCDIVHSAPQVVAAGRAQNNTQAHTWPAEIWLQVGDCDNGAEMTYDAPMRNEVTWCAESIDRNDVRYVRAAAPVQPVAVPDGGQLAKCAYMRILNQRVFAKGKWNYFAEDQDMEALSRFFSAAPAAQSDAKDTCAEMRALCSACGGTGDVHGLDGEWRGQCTCVHAWQQRAEKAEVELAAMKALMRRFWTGQYFDGVTKGDAAEINEALKQSATATASRLKEEHHV